MTHRYPGPRSFTGDDRHLFFGRDAEKQELFRLIVLNDLVVLFGESGSGKTSLLQAGVCPELEERQYKPVFIRLNNTDETPELQVCHQLKEGGYIPADLPENLSLWDYFSRFWYVDLGEVYTPVIVFDQFEELFTLYTPEQRAAFIEQFAAIANRRPPVRQLAEAAAAPQSKFVFSLRSDFLYLLDELSADIPAILRCRFQLRLLDRNGAKDAIIRPGAMQGDYASLAFGYSPAAIDGILDALGRVSEGASEAVSSNHRLTTEIAAFQLQLVCRHLENKIIRLKLPVGFQVSPDFYGNEPGIRQIIEEFYHLVIEKIPADERDAVEKLLARGLIRNGRRIMMEASAMREEYGVSQAALELMHDERLLKREARKGELYYEISHDTLVKPILERFKKIEAAEQAAEAERLRQQAEEEKQRADEAERLKNEAITAQKAAETEKKNAQKMTFYAIGLAFLACLASLGAGYLYDQAEKETLTAYASDLAYKSTIALRDGDRNAAFRLAEFAHRYIEAGNPNVTRALVEALYYNDNPDPAHPSLPRVANFEGHGRSIRSVAFSPDGKRLATGSRDKTVKIWDLDSGIALLTLEGHASFVLSVAFSPDGNRLASGSDDNTVKIWDLDNGKTLMTLKEHANSIYSVAFSPDGKRLASGSSDNTAKIWDLDSGKALMTLVGHAYSFNSIAFSPDGKRLASGSQDSTAKIWDLDSGKALMTLEGHTDDVLSVVFSPDGKKLASGSRDNTAKIWELDSGKALMTFEGHAYSVNSVVFSPNGKRLASGSDDNTAKIWDLDSGKALMTLSSHSYSVLSVAFSPDGKRLASGSDDNTAKIWELDSGKALMTLEEHTSYILSVAFSPDGKTLASGSDDKTAKIWGLVSGKALMTLEGYVYSFNSIAFSPDGKTLASGSDDKTAKIWDLVSGKALMTLEEHNSFILSVAFSPDGRRLATGSRDKTVRIWDLDSGKALMTLSGHTEAVLSVVFHPMEKRLASGSRDNTAKIWDLDSGKALMTLAGHAYFVNTVAFSPDGKMLASGSGDSTAKIWDLDSGKALMTLEGHAYSVNSVAFSPDGNRLATGSRDKTVKIWDLGNGKESMTLSGHTKAINSIAFSPDGRRLATGSSDNTAKIWDLSGDAVIKRWQESGKQAGLIFPQIQQYNLDALLTQHSDNEQKLIATKEVWQIKAFADLAASQAGGSNILSKVEPIYARADRLYAAALALQDELLIRMDYAKMLRRWAAVYKSEGMVDRAGELVGKADGLWKGE